MLCWLLSFSWIRWCHRVFVSFAQIFHFDAHLVSLNFISVEILNDDSSFFRIINMIIENWNQCHDMYQPYRWFLINFSFCLFSFNTPKYFSFFHTLKRCKLKQKSSIKNTLDIFCNILFHDTTCTELIRV